MATALVTGTPDAGQLAKLIQHLALATSFTCLVVVVFAPRRRPCWPSAPVFPQRFKRTGLHDVAAGAFDAHQIKRGCDSDLREADVELFAVAT